MSFRGFLADLKKDGLLKEVHESVSPVLEVTDRAWGKGPILFDNVDGHKCCLNILGTRPLLARALGIVSSRYGISSRLPSATRVPFARWTIRPLWSASLRPISPGCPFSLISRATAALTSLLLLS